MCLATFYEDKIEKDVDTSKRMIDNSSAEKIERILFLQRSTDGE